MITGLCGYPMVTVAIVQTMAFNLASNPPRQVLYTQEYRCGLMKPVECKDFFKSRALRPRSVVPNNSRSFADDGEY